MSKQLEDWEQYKARMSEPVYMQPNIKQIMAEHLAKQVVREVISE